MKRYALFQAFWRSFYSKDFYNDVARNWKGVGFLHLLLLVAIVWLFIMIKAQVGLSRFVDIEAPKVVSQLPPIQITNGRVSVDAPMPYYIKEPSTGLVLFIIDTTGEVDSLDNTEARVLLTKNKLIGKKKSAETRMYDLSGVEDFYLDSAIITKWFSVFKTWFLIAAYPFVVAFVYAYRIVQALLYAAIGLIFASIFKVNLRYAALIRLSVMAVTPAIILNTVVSLTGAHIPYWSLLCFVIAMAYLFFGVKSSRLPEPATIAPIPPLSN
jgi:hypothetical protein